MKGLSTSNNLNLMSIDNYPEIKSLAEAESFFKNSVNMQKRGALISGWILTQIQKKELFKPNFESFTGYLKSERFGYSRWQAYKWMDAFEEFRNYDVKLLDKVGIEKLYQILAIKDRVIRKGMLEKAEDLTVSEVREKVEDIQRFNKNIDESVKEGDSSEDKCLRLGKTLLLQLNAFKIDLKANFEALKEGIEKFVRFTQRYPNNKTIQGLKDSVYIEWKKIKG